LCCFCAISYKVKKQAGPAPKSRPSVAKTLISQPRISAQFFLHEKTVFFVFEDRFYNLSSIPPPVFGRGMIRV